MRKLAVALAVSTIAFAASTLYFWRELRIARQEMSLAPTAATPAVESPPATTVEPTPAAMNAAPNRPDAQPPGTETEAEARARSLASMRTMFEDPLKREEMMRVSRAGFRSSFPRLAEHLGLTEDQYTRLVNQLAEHQMHWAERRYRCLLEPGCDEMAAMKGIGAERERELTDILGPEKYQQFNEYLDNQQERRAVMLMRGELPDALRMTDVQAEKLVAALGEERRGTLKEWEQSGAVPESLNSEYGELYHSSTAQDIEQRVAEATELQRRQHDRAAQILTAGQLKIFDERQALALEQARRMWQSHAQEGEHAMNRFALALGVTSVIFAGTTVYFARELQRERASHAPRPDKSSEEEKEAPARKAQHTRNAESHATLHDPDNRAQELHDPTAADQASTDEVSSSFAYSVTTNSGQGKNLSEAEQRQAAIDQSRKFLAEIADPAGRERALAQHKAMLLVGTQGLADYLKLDPDEFARFIDLQAQHALAQREIATRCMLDLHCMYRGPGDDLIAAQEREIASAFGADKIERYNYFMRSSNERQAVAELRGRLPDTARLSDAKADELVRVWVDESQRIQQDMKRVGYGIGTQNSMVYVVMDEDPDGARAAAAAEYNQRWRELAGTVLTPEQLAVYTRLQQEALDRTRAFEEMRQTSN